MSRFADFFKVKFNRISGIILGLILLSGIFNSCGKESKVMQYQIIFGTLEVTQPRDIPDENVKDVYMQILSDIDQLKSRVDDSWQIDIVNDKFGPEDQKAEAKYNSHLPEVKELEASCKRRIQGLGSGSGSSFSTKVVYKLTRSVPADHSSTNMQEYVFELKYN